MDKIKAREIIPQLLRRLDALESDLRMFQPNQIVLQEMIDDLTLKVNALDYCVDTNSYYE